MSVTGRWRASRVVPAGTLPLMKMPVSLALVAAWLAASAWLAWTIGGLPGYFVGIVGAVTGIAPHVPVTPKSDTPQETPEIDVLAQSRKEHRAGLDAYAEWEFNPEMLLRFPGLWDTSRPETQRFFDALSAATLAEPEGPATDAQVSRYAAAVDELQMAWAGAERYARSTGTSKLSARFRTEADTGLKLYRHAQGAVTAEERQTYYRRALEKVRALVQAGLLPATLPAVDRLEAEQRGELVSPPGPTLPQLRGR